MPYIGRSRWRPRMTAHTQKSKILATVDPVWSAIQANAKDICANEPSLGGMVISNVLNHESFEAALAHRLAERLDHTDVSADLIRQAFHDALDQYPEIGNDARAD